VGKLEGEVVRKGVEVVESKGWVKVKGNIKK